MTNTTNQAAPFTTDAAEDARAALAARCAVRPRRTRAAVAVGDAHWALATHPRWGATALVLSASAELDTWRWHGDLTSAGQALAELADVADLALVAAAGYPAAAAVLALDAGAVTSNI